MKKALLMLFIAMFFISLLTAAVFAEEPELPENAENLYIIDAVLSDTVELSEPEIIEVPQETEVTEMSEEHTLFKVTPLPEPTEATPLEIAPPETVLVSFDMCGYGNPVAPQEIIIGTAVVEPLTPQCDGKVFKGWFNEPECILPWNFDALVCANTVLYAGWEDVSEAEQESIAPDEEEPETEEPVTEEPETEEPLTEEPVTEEPITEESVTEEPVTEEPVTEEPETEEPVTEEPLTVEPVTEEYEKAGNTETAHEAYVAVVGVGENAVKYTTLQSAIDACPRFASKTSTVRLITDTAESVLISAGQKITLDLGGNTIYGTSNGNEIDPLFIQEASVTLMNGQISAESDNAVSVSGIVNYGGKLVIQDVDVVCSTGAAGGKAKALYETGRFKNAYMKILSGRFYAAADNAVTVENAAASVLHIYGGCFSSDGSTACSVKVNSKGSTTIVGGNFFGHIQRFGTGCLKITKGMYSEVPDSAFIMYGSRCRGNTNPVTSELLPYAVV